MNYELELATALAVAERAGQVALQYQRDGVVAEQKADLSPVTLADKECERLIVEELRTAFPADGLLGEEGTTDTSQNGRRWIIDPIDGTRDFVRGNPRWAILLALEVAGQVVLGVAHFPALGETYQAVKGGGAWCNGRRLRASGISQAASAVAHVNGLITMYRQPYAQRLVPWMGQFFAVRSLGGCPDAMLIATGQADIWIEPSCQAWDLAPLKVILEEAGAVFMNFDGGASIYAHNCIACAPGLVDVARSLLPI